MIFYSPVPSVDGIIARSGRRRWGISDVELEWGDFVPRNGGRTDRPTERGDKAPVRLPTKTPQPLVVESPLS